MTALHFSCLFGDFGVARPLVAAGADLNKRTEEFEKTALHLAIEFLFVDLVRLLVEAGADVTATAVHSPSGSRFSCLQLVRIRDEL